MNEKKENRMTDFTAIHADRRLIGVIGSMRMNKDTVYRQDAIDAVADGLKMVFVENRDVAEILLKNVPSAQPEIVRCKDCRWKNKHFCNRAVELFIHDEDFCSWAERLEE